MSSTTWQREQGNEKASCRVADLLNQSPVRAVHRIARSANEPARGDEAPPVCRMNPRRSYRNTSSHRRSRRVGSGCRKMAELSEWTLHRVPTPTLAERAIVHGFANAADVRANALSYSFQRWPLPGFSEVPVDRQFRLRLETHALNLSEKQERRNIFMHGSAYARGYDATSEGRNRR
jgi:hypothetical protein